MFFCNKVPSSELFYKNTLYIELHEAGFLLLFIYVAVLFAALENKSKMSK